MPSIVPTSTTPSAAPTITGSIVVVDMNRLVTSSLTNDEITGIINEAENIFDVNPGDAEVEVTYDITGSVLIETDGSDVSEEDLASALQKSIASALNIHQNDISVLIDSDTGIASYTISSASAEEASNLQDSLQDISTSNEVVSLILENIPSITNVPPC